jgi:hypothetical protein
MPSDNRRKALAATFDRAADLYQRARPDYPDALLDDIVAVAGLAPTSKIRQTNLRFSAPSHLLNR